MDIGKKIKSIRISKGLTMKEFGELFDPAVKTGVISNWESGKQSPNKRRIKRISEISGISTDELMDVQKIETEISQRLKEYIQRKNISQSEIIKKSIPFQKKYGINMTKSHLSQYVNGKSEPHSKQLYLLSKTLDVSMGWLLGYEEN